MDYRELLIDKDRVVVASVDLAIVLGGIEEAVALNQISYWLEKYKETNHNFKDGKYWVYNSYKKWHESNFPFWHPSKIQRIFSSLESKGVLISANYNTAGFDKTKWYSIDYDTLQNMIDERFSENKNSLTEHEQSLSESEQSLSVCDYPIPEVTTETTSRGYPQETTSHNKDYIKNSIHNSEQEMNNMYAGFPKQENPGTEKKSRFIPVDYTEEQFAEHVKPVYQKVIDGYYGHIDDGAEKDTETLTKITVYFHRKFQEKYHSRCRILSDKAYIRIAEKFCDPTEVMENIYDFERYAGMIDRYFETNCNERGNYDGDFEPSLAHFMSDTIRENLYRKMDY